MRKQRLLHSAIIGGLMAALFVVFSLFFANASFQAILANSVFVETGTYYPLLFLGAWLAFSVMTYHYFLIDFRLPGPKSFKATLYVVSQLLILLLYVSEPLPHRVDLDWLVNPLKLVILFMVQGKLIQSLLARERLMYRPKPFFYPRGILVYMLTFTLFRMLTYWGLDGYQASHDMFGISLMWTLSMGLAIGLSFSTIQRYLLRQDQKGKSQAFALSFFASYSIAYHAYMLLTYQLSWWDMVSRCALDVFAVWLATWIILYFQINERQEITPYSVDGKA
ncbi:hypothetical protein [Aerococcus kribbianus]|uniref:Uncharacterized protein n=1 Tax=Aerococcus kribbianus TaxID=2999064 RepID=A0A9X3FN47_9LACT|nr:MULTISPECIES: hypothetical protein [unclassified Aerococcus]MCZ0717540.1 hypothetical protein [Aerococcus sp. YH-aer221]MCZ0725828.1 hypothetical protein [Aerococcus sp. YH-aer222]